MRLLSVTLALCVLAGCAHGPIGQLPTVDSLADAATVVIIRKSALVNMTVTYNLSFDGQKFFGIRNGEHISFQTTPGDHFLGVSVFGGWSPTTKHYEIPVFLVAQQTNYYLVHPTFSAAEIEPLSGAEGAELMKHSQGSGDKQRNP